MVAGGSSVNNERASHTLRAAHGDRQERNVARDAQMRRRFTVCAAAAPGRCGGCAPVVAVEAASVPSLAGACSGRCGAPGCRCTGSSDCGRGARVAVAVAAVGDAAATAVASTARCRQRSFSLVSSTVSRSGA